MPADWQLPPGVSRQLWDYLHDPDVARSYDASLAGTSLLAYDQDFVLRHCQPPGRIADLGCGTGRLSLTLARQGFRPLAIDLSSEMLRVLGEKAASAKLDVLRLQANLVQLDCLADQSFDHAACLFSTLGLIEGDANRRRFLEHVHRILRPGGVFVLHVHNRWFHLGTVHGRGLLCKDLYWSLFGKGSGGDFLMAPHQGIGGLIMHLFTRREIIRLLTRTGFALIETRPISIRPDGRLTVSWLLPQLRAYGYLIAAKKA